MLRFQQYIELVRTQNQSKLLDSIAHAKKYLLPYRELFPKEVQQACGLLAFPPGTSAPIYNVSAAASSMPHRVAHHLQDLYSSARWQTLADLFVQTHHALLALPAVPPLHIALSAGLSALKTPSCHSSHASSISPHASSAVTTSVCPICSTELNDLARHVPYAHHTKSHVESDLVLLPNGCVYGTGRLEEYSRKAGLPESHVKDIRHGLVYDKAELKKVYIS